MTDYIRPLMQVGPARPEDAVPFGWCWFTHVEVLSRNAPARVIRARDLTEAQHAQFSALTDWPGIMGILNVTPDSFSDGGQHETVDQAVARAKAMEKVGVSIIDVGGESTRPGAQPVPVETELARTIPVIEAIRVAGVETPISIDTRKSPVAEAALLAGATIVNDVSGFTYDPALVDVCVRHHCQVCVMHAQGDPQTMQDNPRYNDVLLDVYDFLRGRIDTLVSAGIAKADIIADPGIGFGKSQTHNLRLLARLSLFHGLGVPILLGASRKRFIGTLGNAPYAQDRAPGSIAVALAAIAQGVQIIRAHDVAEHGQAIALWRASVAHR